MNTSHLNHFADSMFGIEKTPADADAEVTRYTAHRALPLPKERQWVAPQGRPAWPARRCSSEPIVIDRLPEAYDSDDQSESADHVLLWFFGAIFLALLCAWCLANYLDAAHVA